MDINIKKRENFEWYFECKSEEVKKADKKTYSYETSPIYKEKCQKCSGTGTDPQPITCTSCSGKGTRVNQYDNKTYQCSTCKGTGKVYNKCGTCYGVGIVSYPKSVKPPVISSITWNGAVVEVVTNPPGAKISVVNTKTQEYQSVGMSNLKVDWYSSSEKSYPIIIEYQGQTSKVLPYNASGKLIPKVVINFIGGSPNVTAGQRVN